ncbi:methylated-DNA--[protein]-cysteine S-methyltransferase [Bulleidia sp. zg-1006]|uniref:methylated-DNA--[protein]-cysteine S-methyltransferase n=1 Tax=Bulleidia sp. zg-1006 TaxID=2806552 RepID=UPI0019398745|nr:methylated-DNA--[protein]-cysteine S-methyltransferase [Bulleidia sp. zg-1006]QRG86555.1 methylated-DNA--[protein]-cysteine S-methyltransferase [Bulleidia sp. zg-1006]
MVEEIISVNAYRFCVRHKDEEIYSILLSQKEGKKAGSKLANHLIYQLEEYFAGKRKSFDLKLHFEGTSFQKSCWKALLKIPYGETRTYQEIARKIGKGKACRAVGQAIHRNPFVIVVPCHRVILKDGSLGGYLYGEEMKRTLLELEKNP